MARVHGLIDEARSSRSSQATIASIFAASGTAFRSASRGSAPEYRSPIRYSAGQGEGAPTRCGVRTVTGHQPRRASAAVSDRTGTRSTDVISTSLTAVRIPVPTLTRGRSHDDQGFPARIPADGADRRLYIEESTYIAARPDRGMRVSRHAGAGMNAPCSRRAVDPVQVQEVMADNRATRYIENQDQVRSTHR